MTTPRDVLEFWFSPPAQLLWFEKDASFDSQIRSRFGRDVHAAQQGELDHWQRSVDGALAVVLILDQFARNIYRGSAKAFLGDERARGIADKAIARNFDQQVDLLQQRFFYWPFGHSENLTDQQRAVDLFTAAVERAGPEDRDDALVQLDSAHRHRLIISRFSRFPHRNDALGRPSSEAEIAFLREPDSSF